MSAALADSGGRPMVLRDSDWDVLEAISTRPDCSPRELRAFCCPTNDRFHKLWRYGLIDRDPIPSWLVNPKRVNFTYRITPEGHAALRARHAVEGSNA